MARREIIEFVDDMDGTSDATVKTRYINVDGTAREIDLSDKNYNLMMAALAPFLENSRLAKPALTSVRGGRANGVSAAQKARDNDAMRKGLKLLGWPVKERGRIPARQQMAFHAGERCPDAKAPAPAKKAAAKKAVPAAAFTADLVTQAAAKEAVVPTQKAVKKAPASRKTSAKVA